MKWKFCRLRTLLYFYVHSPKHHAPKNVFDRKRLTNPEHGTIIDMSIFDMSTVIAEEIKQRLMQNGMEHLWKKVCTC